MHKTKKYSCEDSIDISNSVVYFVCFLFVLGLTSLWNIWGHITTVPACSSGTLTNLLPHRNAMPQTQDLTPHPVTVYRQGAGLSLCYPLMWFTLEYTATHFSVLGETRPGNPSPTFHAHQWTLNLMLSWWSTVGSSVESTVPTGDLWCANPVRYPLRSRLRWPHSPVVAQQPTQCTHSQLNNWVLNVSYITWFVHRSRDILYPNHKNVMFHIKELQNFVSSHISYFVKFIFTKNIPINAN